MDDAEGDEIPNSGSMQFSLTQGLDVEDHGQPIVLNGAVPNTGTTSMPEALASPDSLANEHFENRNLKF